MVRGQPRFLIAPLLWVVGLAACGGSEPQPAPPPPPPPPPAVEVAQPPPAPTAEAPAPPAAPPQPDIAIGPTTASDNPKKAPKALIKAPAKEQVVAADKAKDFEVKTESKDWEVAPGSSHVHLILDNHPYKPVYDTKGSVKLSELVGPNDTIAEGEHVLVAFPSRMNHESVKMPGVVSTAHFWVGKKGTASWKEKDPTLVYSRPKGSYNASKADHVLLDFQLLNAELGEGKYSVKASVKGPGLDDGKTLVIKEWKPYALDNLRNGDYVVSLELDDKDGKPVPGAWNSTTRTITINRDAPEDPPPPVPETKKDEKKEKVDAAKADKKADKPKEEKPADKK